MTGRVINGELIREDKKTYPKEVFFLLFHYLYNTIVNARRQTIVITRRNKIVIVHGKYAKEVGRIPQRVAKTTKQRGSGNSKIIRFIEYTSAMAGTKRIFENGIYQILSFTYTG